MAMFPEPTRDLPADGLPAGAAGTTEEFGIRLRPIKLYVDDLRDPPDDTWTVARTSAEAMDILRSGTPVDELSLDHDLGGDDTTRPIVLHLAEYGGWPVTVRVHTANPVGTEWLIGMVTRYGPGVTR